MVRNIIRTPISDESVNLGLSCWIRGEHGGHMEQVRNLLKFESVVFGGAGTPYSADGKGA